MLLTPARPFGRLAGRLIAALLGCALTAQAGANTLNSDFLGNYSFRVEIDGVSIGNFRYVDGLSNEIEVIEFQEGAAGTMRKRPGKVKYGDITLKMGYLTSTFLDEWLEAARRGNASYRARHMLITLCAEPNRQGEQVCTEWKACNVFPRRWKLNPRSKVEGIEVVTEQVTFAIEELIYQPTSKERNCLPPAKGPLAGN